MISQDSTNAVNKFHLTSSTGASITDMSSVTSFVTVLNSVIYTCNMLLSPETSFIDCSDLLNTSFESGLAIIEFIRGTVQDMYVPQ